jgi:hypothetical protein
MNELVDSRVQRVEGAARMLTSRCLAEGFAAVGQSPSQSLFPSNTITHH